MSTATQEAPMPATDSTFTPLRKHVFVRANPERAFRRFTDEIATWWPTDTHSVGQVNCETVVFEGRVGGHIVERIRGGRECVWGTITAWDPPRRVAFTWHPGREAESAQELEVLFSPDGEGTRVELIHTGFERLGPTLGRKARRGYPIGWEYVLGVYAQRGGPLMWLLSGLTNVMALAYRLRRRGERTGASTTS